MPNPRIFICCYCRKRIFKARNGEWYHERTASTACWFGTGSRKRATPVEIEVGHDG